MPDLWQSASNEIPVTQEELETVSKELLKAAGDRTIWLFFGEMGSGKTTLIKAIGKFLGVNDTMSSPTFSIVNEYEAAHGRKIYHFDLYRLKSEREIFDIGVEEYFYSGELCLVEWPERLGSLVPSGSFNIRMTPTDDFHRKIEYQRA